jgi:hypothetical protein
VPLFTRAQLQTRCYLIAAHHRPRIRHRFIVNPRPAIGNEAFGFFARPAQT